jgi:hypothetical protein
MPKLPPIVAVGQDKKLNAPFLFSKADRDNGRRGGGNIHFYDSRASLSAEKYQK